MRLRWCWFGWFGGRQRDAPASTDIVHHVKATPRLSDVLVPTQDDAVVELRPRPKQLSPLTWPSRSPAPSVVRIIPTVDVCRPQDVDQHHTGTEHPFESPHYSITPKSSNATPAWGDDARSTSQPSACSIFSNHKNGLADPIDHAKHLLLGNFLSANSDSPWNQYWVLLAARNCLPGESCLSLETMEPITTPRRRPYRTVRRAEVAYTRTHGGACDRCRRNKKAVSLPSSSWPLKVAC